MKNVITATMLSLSLYGFGQIGVNTPEPKSTFDIQAKNPTGTSTNAEGLLIPRIDRERAQSMTGVQNSTLVFINDITTGTQTGTAVSIDMAGYYYFNGSVWIPLKTNATGLKENIYSTNGVLSSDRTVDQQDKTIAFTGTTVNSFSVDGSTFSVDAQNNRIGLGTVSPETRLDFITVPNEYGLQHSDGNIKLRTYLGAGGSNGNTDAGWFGTKSAHPLDLMTQSIFRMRIDADGKVGIGTPTPSTKLEVKQEGLDNDAITISTEGTSYKSQIGNYQDGNARYMKLSSIWSGDADKRAFSLQTIDGEAVTITRNRKVGIGTSTPHPSAILDVSSTTQGFLPPRMTTAQRDSISSKAEGLTIYNTSVKLLQYWNGTAWQNYN